MYVYGRQGLLCIILKGKKLTTLFFWGGGEIKEESFRIGKNFALILMLIVVGGEGCPGAPHLGGNLQRHEPRQAVVGPQICTIPQPSYFFCKDYNYLCSVGESGYSS